MTVNQIVCPDCGRPPGVGRDTCAACGAILDPSLRPPGPAAAGVGGPAGRPGQAPLLADLPFAVPADGAGKIVAIAAWAAAIGFLLPWAPAVIGAAGIGGYVDGWGLATMTHLPIFIAAAAIGLLVLLPNPIPGWLTVGIVPIVLGGLLVGLSWPYLVGGLGSGIGLLIDAAAAIALVIGGALRLAPWRHEASAPPVE